MPNLNWGLSNDDWSNPLAWLEGFVPGTFDDVFVAGGNVTNASAATAMSLTLQNAGTLSTTGDLTVAPFLGGGGYLRVGGGTGLAQLFVSGGTTSADNLTVGYAGNGRVSVSGSGILTTNTLSVGDGGGGTLRITGGGTVTSASTISVGAGANTGVIAIGGLFGGLGATASASGTLNGNIVFGNSTSALQFFTNDTATYSGIILGLGGVRQQSVGQIAILTGNNFYGGETFIRAGATLQIGDGGTTGSMGTGIVTNNGVLTFDRSNNETIANTISGSGAVNILSGGRTTFTADNNYSGLTSIAAGATLVVGNGGTTGSLGTGAVVNDGTLDFNFSHVANILNSISGNGNVELRGGTNFKIISGLNSYTGTTTIAAGQFVAVNSSFGTGDIVNNGWIYFQTPGPYTITSVISGSGGFLVNGGTLILTNNNTYSGNTEITGTLQIGNGGYSGSLGTGAVVNNGTLDFFRPSNPILDIDISGSGNVIFRGANYGLSNSTLTHTGTTTITAGTNLYIVGTNIGSTNFVNDGLLDLSIGATVSGTISGTGSLIARSNATVNLLNNNTYSGTTDIWAVGTLNIGNGGTTGSLGTGAVSNAGTLHFNRSGTLGLGVVSGAGSIIFSGGGIFVANGGYNLTGTATINATTTFFVNIGTLNNSSIVNNGFLTFGFPVAVSYGGVISGTGSMTARDGTTRLTGNNTYSGQTVITSFGTLQIGNGGTTGSLGTGAVVNNGTLAFNRSDDFQILNSISGAGSLTFSAGSAGLRGSNSYSGGTTINSGATVFVFSNSSFGSGNVANNGTIRLTTTANLPVSNVISGTGNLIVDSPNLALTGNNTYTGTTFIASPATLQIGNGGTTGSLGTGAVNSEGTLHFNRTGLSYIVANDISGSGNVIFGGGGGTIINVTGTNSYSGGSTITAGSIARFFDSNDLGTGLVTINGTLIYSGTAATPFSNMIAGSGSFVINMTAGNAFLGGAISVQAGSTLAFTINGTASTDIIKANLTVRNTINGGDANDQIRAGNLVDTIDGGNGNDKIMSLGGADVLTGGAGADQFRYFSQSDSGLGAAADRITDYVIGSDRLNFFLLDADTVTAGDQAFNFIGTGAFAATGVGQIRYTNSGADILVQADTDGNGVADMEIILQGLNGGTLTGADFIL